MKKQQDKQRFDLNTNLVWLLEQLRAKDDPILLEQVQRFAANPDAIMPPGCQKASKIVLPQGLKHVGRVPKLLTADTDGVYITAFGDSRPGSRESSERFIKVSLSQTITVTEEGDIDLLDLYQGLPLFKKRSAWSKQKKDITKRDGAILCGPDVSSVTIVHNHPLGETLVFTKDSPLHVDVYMWRGGTPQRIGIFCKPDSVPCRYVRMHDKGIVFMAGSELFCQSGSSAKAELVLNDQYVLNEHTGEHVKNGLNVSRLYQTIWNQKTAFNSYPIGEFRGTCRKMATLATKSRDETFYAMLQDRRHQQVGWSIFQHPLKIADLVPLEPQPAFNAVSLPMIDPTDGRCFYWAICKDWIYKMELPLEVISVKS